MSRTEQQSIDWASKFIDEINKHLEEENCTHPIHLIIDKFFQKGLQNGQCSSN